MTIPYISGRTYDPTEALVTPVGPGTKYYVDGVNGNDAYDGRSLTTAFKTVQRAMNALTNGGDTVLIRKGIYRETPSLSSKSAPNGNPFVIGPYGDGEVVLDGSTAVTGWTQYSGNIYRALPGFVPSNVVINYQPLYTELSLAALQASPTDSGVPTDARWFYDSASGYLYVRTNLGSPAGQDVGVVKFDRTGNNGLYLFQSNNYVIYGLTIRFSEARGLNFYGGNNIRAEKNRLLFNSWSGIQGDGLSNSQIIKNYVYHNMFSNWPRGKFNGGYGGWASGIGFGYPTNVTVDGNISQKSGGEGILAYLGAGGTIFRNNISIDNFSVNLYIDNQPNGLLEGNLLICSKMNTADVYNGPTQLSPPNPDAYASTASKMRPIGIMTADENYSGTATLSNIMIRNNIVINCRRGLEHYGQAPGSALKYVSVLNNTIIMPTDLLPNYEIQSWDNLAPDIVGISIPYNSGLNIGTLYQNNIIYGGYWGATLMRLVTYDASNPNFLGVTIDHNVFYQPNPSGKFFLWGPNWGSYYTYAGWLALPGGAHGAGDLTSNPLLVNAATDSAFDKNLQTGSPAIDAGVSAVTSDFAGAARPRGFGYDMGAFERQ